MLFVLYTIWSSSVGYRLCYLCSLRGQLGGVIAIAVCKPICPKAELFTGPFFGRFQVLSNHLRAVLMIVDQTLALQYPYQSSTKLLI